MKKRIIKLKSVKNLRTLGGLSGKDGTVREGILLRSAALNRISEQDGQLLRDRYGVRLIVDLRTDDEAKKKPDLPIEGVKYLHIPVCATEIPGVSKQAVPGQPGNPEMLPDLNDMYRAMVTRPDCIAGWSTILQTILNHRDGAVLWHCTAGKDRCGLTAMFLLLMLGIDYDTIVDDYLITNRTSRKTGRRYYWEIRLFLHDKPYAEKVRSTYDAKREFLDSARRAIDEQFGSMDDFLIGQLGLTRQQIDAFRAYALQ